MPEHFLTIAGKRERIITHFEYPPIPVRNMDWSAVTDNYDGAPDAHSPIGRGETEEAAIEDLKAQLEDAANYCGGTGGDHEWAEGVDIGGEPDERIEVIRCLKCGEVLG
jgi:hypothetical protein